MNDFKNSFSNFWNIIKGNKNKEKIKILKELAIYILILIFLKTPLIMFRDLVTDYFNSKSSVNILGIIFFYMFELLYILLFIFMLKKWFTKKFSTQNNK